MAQILVAYATRSGAAADVSDAVAEVLRAAGHDVDVADLRDKPTADADQVGDASGVNAGAWYPEAKAWLARNTGAVRGTKVAVFNTCLGAADPAKRADSLAYNTMAVDRVGAVASEAFAGRFVPDRVGWFRRTFLKTMQQPEKDHLDLDVVRAWASTLLREVA